MTLLLGFLETAIAYLIIESFWFFPIVLALLLVGIRKSTYRITNFSTIPLFCLIAMVGAFAYRYPVMRPFFVWPSILWLLSGYFLIGLLVAIVRWVQFGIEFRNAGKKYMLINPNAPREELFKELQSNSFYHRKYSVESRNGKFLMVPNRSTISNYIMYWPLLSLEVVYDVIQTVCKSISQLFMRLFNQISEIFSV